MFKQSLYIVFTLFVICSSQVNATSIYPDQQISSILEDNMLGSEMIGMSITTIAGGSVSTHNWTGSGSFGLTFPAANDTFATPWTYTNSTASAIDQLVLDAFGASAVFDTIFNPPPGVNTPGSANGDLFVMADGITATADGLVGVDGLGAVGDLARYVVFDFSTPLATNASFSFFLDTDKVVLAPVPVPPPLFLYTSGLLALAFSRFTRRKS